jgi:hypothetical protein
VTRSNYSCPACNAKLLKRQLREPAKAGEQAFCPHCIAQLSEVTVVEPPASIRSQSLRPPAKSGPSNNEGDGNEISVLVTPQGRLQISADLDVKGLGKLKQILEEYEQILKLLQ